MLVDRRGGPVFRTPSLQSYRPGFHQTCLKARLRHCLQHPLCDVPAKLYGVRRGATAANTRLIQPSAS